MIENALTRQNELDMLIMEYCPFINARGATRCASHAAKSADRQ